ncbi:MAG: hypothetical protein DKINENOH_00999 [bacterium]|nr:hypothetical protein [bacterium]
MVIAMHFENKKILVLVFTIVLLLLAAGILTTNKTQNPQESKKADGTILQQLMSLADSNTSIMERSLSTAVDNDTSILGQLLSMVGEDDTTALILRNFIENENNDSFWRNELNEKKSLAILLEKILSDSSGNDLPTEKAIANNYRLMGVAYRHLKQYESAFEHFRIARALYQGIEAKYSDTDLHDIDDEIAYTYWYDGNAYTDIGEYQKASSSYRRAYDICEDKIGFLQLNIQVGSLWVTDHKLEPAIDHLLKLLDITLRQEIDDKTKEICKLIERSYGLLATSISWNLETMELREDAEPSDFVDDIYTAELDQFITSNPKDTNQTSTDLLNLIRIGFSSGGKKLSMMHPLEERGSFVATMYLSRNLNSPQHDLVNSIKVEMERGNFEPAAKYLYFEHIDGHFYETLQLSKSLISRLTFEEVISKIKSYDTSLISEWTTKVIELLYKGDIFLREHAR